MAGVRTGSIGCLLVLLLTSGLVHAAKPVTGFGREKPVTIEDYRPHLMDDEGYYEEWSHGIWSKDGDFMVGVDFSIHNLNMTSDHDGRLSATYKDKSGRETKCKLEFDDDQWSSAKNGFALKFGKSTLSGDLKGVQVKVRCKKLSLDLKFENQVPPLRPGGGLLKFGDEGVYSRVFTCPRAKASGTVTVKGKTHEIDGIGYVNHSYYNMRPDKNVRRWFRFKTFKGEFPIVMDEMETSRDYGLASNGWVLVTGEQGRILSTARVNFQYDGLIKDTKSEEGYKIPRRVRIAAVDGKTNLTGVLLMKRIKKIKDFTADMGAVKRAVVRRYTKPKDYVIECSYSFRLKSDTMDRKIEGDGVFRFVYVNP